MSGAPGRDRLERHDAERLVERRDHRAGRFVQQPHELLVAHEPGELHRLARTPSPRATPRSSSEYVPRPTIAQRRFGRRAEQPRHRADQRLEALLVLEATPRDEQRRVAAGAGDASAREASRVDAVRHHHDLVAGELERAHDLLDHEARAADHALGLVGEPPLGGVDRLGSRAREVTLMAPELGRVHRRDERRLVGLAQGVARPRAEPVVRVHDVGLPRAGSRAPSCASWWLPEITCASGLSVGTQGRSTCARSTRTPSSSASSGA